MVFLTKQVTDSENHLTPRFKVGREKRIEIWYYRKKKKFTTKNNICIHTAVRCLVVLKENRTFLVCFSGNKTLKLKKKREQSKTKYKKKKER